MELATRRSPLLSNLPLSDGWFSTPEKPSEEKFPEEELEDEEVEEDVLRTGEIQRVEEPPPSRLTALSHPLPASIERRYR